MNTVTIKSRSKSPCPAPILSPHHRVNQPSPTPTIRSRRIRRALVQEGSWQDSLLRADLGSGWRPRQVHGAKRRSARWANADLDRPALEGGKATVVACPMSEEQSRLQEEIVQRYERFKTAKVDPRIDNAL